MPTNDKTYMREYIKKYALRSPVILCECGVEIKEYNKYKHRRVSKQHYIFKNKNVEADVEKMLKEVDVLKRIITPVK